MKTIKKLILAAMLALCSAGLFAVDIFHDYDYQNPRYRNKAYWTKSGYWTYSRLTNKTCAIVDFDILAVDKDEAWEEDLYIPSEINGLTVTEIANSPFSWSPSTGAISSTVKRIHIPDTITFIEQGSFSFLNDGITSMEFILEGNNRAYTIWKNGLYSIKDKALITSFEISEAAYISVYGYDYYDCYGTDYFRTKPDTRVICSGALNSNTRSNYIDLNDGLEIIENSGFGDIAWGSSIQRLEIPASVIVFKTEYWDRFPNIISFEEGSIFERDGNLIYNKETKTAFARIDNVDIGKVLRIKDGTEIFKEMRLWDLDLDEIIFPDSVRVIENFYLGTDKKIKIRIPKYVEELGIVESENDTIPDSVKLYTGIKPVKVGKNNPYLKVENGMLLSKDGTILYQIFDVPKNGILKIPDTVKYLKEPYISSAKFSKITEIILPEGLEEIEASFLFRNYHTTKPIRIPAKTKFVHEEVLSIWASCPAVEVDPNNPYLATDGEFFYNKETKNLYCVQVTKPDTEIVIPSYIKNMSQASFNKVEGASIKSMKILNPGTIPSQYFNYMENGDYEEPFIELLVPNKSQCSKIMDAIHVYYTTY